MKSENHPRGFRAERQLSRGHFIKHHTERKQIGARVEGLPLDLLGRHVQRGADGIPLPGEIVKCAGGPFLAASARFGTMGYFGQSKIQDLRTIAAGDEDIGRLDIPMHDARAVSGIERIGDLFAQR